MRVITVKLSGSIEVVLGSILIQKGERPGESLALDVISSTYNHVLRD